MRAEISSAIRAASRYQTGQRDAALGCEIMVRATAHYFLYGFETLGDGRG